MKQESKVRFAAHYRKSDGIVQSLKEHLEGSSTLACAFAGKIGLSSFGELIGLLHDFGKYTDVFQAYLLSAVGKLNPDDDEYVDAIGMKGKIDHSSAGAQYVWESLQNKDHLQHIAGQIMSLCIASHHSGLMDCLSPDGMDVFSKRMAKSKDKTHLEEARIKIDASIQSRVNELLASTSIENELRQRLESLWCGEQSRKIREFMLGLMVRFIFSALIDADRLNSADFENVTAASKRYNGCYPEWGVLIGKLEAHLADFKAGNQVDKIRSEISSSCLNFASREKGIFQLTVPTGGGKTLASLRFALHHAKHRKMDRIIYVVPYTTIIDQNAKVVRSIFENTEHQLVTSGKQIVLEHHSNLTPERDTWQSKLLSENWDAPIVYTTVVQFLETLFAAGTRGARRMHHLANAVIIFDEIQTIPIRTVHLFNNAINFLVGQCESTVVFCTATQPLLNEVDTHKGAVQLSVNHQIMPDVGKLFKDLRRVEVNDKRKAGGWSGDDVAEEAQQELDRAGSVLVIVNTKAQAREIYRRCKQITDEVFHLSTSMCPAHRMDVLDKVKECLNLDNPKPVICFSTQLIEAGVDVDFGSVIRYLAGLDSIAQAAGRCNRNGLRQTGRVVVVNPTNENLDKLPDIRTAKEKAERVLDEYRNDPTSFGNDRISPEAMAAYYRYHFFSRSHEMDYPVSPKEVGRDDTLLSLLSTNDLSVNAHKRTNNAAPPLHLRQSFKTAAEAFKVIDAPTEGVIVPYGEEGKRIIAELLSTAGRFEKKYELLKQAQRYSVNMFPHEIAKLRQIGSLHEVLEASGILCLDPQYYSNEFGACVEQVALMETLIA
jgi:CRISPR-associated endonuclease/helicase Cas3